MLLDQRPATTDQASTAVERSANVEARALAVATALFGLVLLASLVTQSLLPTVVGVVLAPVVGVVLAATCTRRLTPVVSGGLMWWVACAVATLAILQLGETKQHTLSWSLGITCVVATLPVLARARQQLTDGDTPALLVRGAAKPFTDPVTGLAAALVGTGVALPLVGTYAPVIGDPDSAWFVTSTREVQDHGIGLLQETQDVFVPHLTLGPLLALGGYRAAIPFMILTVVALSALTAYLAYRLTNRGAGALAASVVLLAIPAIPERADRLPMYAAAFFFAYGAGWLLHRAMSDQGANRWLPVGAGLGLVLAYEAHGVGQVFILVPFLLLLLHPWRQARRPLLITFLTMAVASIPRVVVNLSVDGLADFRTNYADFLIQKYLPIVNRDFWGHNNDTTPLGYVTNLPDMTEKALGSRAMLLLLLVPVVLAAVRSGRRARTFVAGSAGIFLLALVVNSPATFGRYLAPLAVGLALVAAVGVTVALRGTDEARLVGRVLLAVLTFAAFFQMMDNVSNAVEQRNTIEGGPTPDLVAAIDDDKTVIGVRPHQLLWTDPSVPTVYGRTMDEEDWVTYISWPDDDTVTEMMDRYDVGWVYVMPDQRLEVIYHETWLEPTYGLTVDHVERLHESDRFCLVTEAGGALLYRYGDCRPGDLRLRPKEFLEPFYGADSEAVEDELESNSEEFGGTGEDGEEDDVTSEADLDQPADLDDLSDTDVIEEEASAET